MAWRIVRRGLERRSRRRFGRRQGFEARLARQSTTGSRTGPRVAPPNFSGDDDFDAAAVEGAGVLVAGAVVATSDRRH
jgi:hypothetical protein